MKDADMQMWLYAASNEAGGSSSAERSFPGGDRGLRVSRAESADTLAERGVFVSSEETILSSHARHKLKVCAEH